MLKAVRRNVGPPSLSITIPPPRRTDVEVRATREMEPEPEYEYEPDMENGEPEPLQKSVKFLAVESDSDDETDQSSICQSPSWEGYGQKKKEKKKEAERKRKEREQAEREARAARKKPSSRLSKAPPVSMRHPPTFMERSNSAPIPEGFRSFAPSRPRQLPAVQDEGELEYQNSDSRSITPEPRDFLGPRNTRFVGGLKLEQERREAAQNQFDPQFPPSFREARGANTRAQDPYQPMKKSYSDGPGMDTLHLGHTPPTSRQGFRAQRDTRPPSSSRTPQLRHIPQDRGLGRSNSLLQSTSKTFRDREAVNQQVPNLYSHASHSQESLHATEPIINRGRFDDGYVRRQRDQNTERAMAGLADEQLSYSAGTTPYSPTRIGTQDAGESRDAKMAPPRRPGHTRTPPAATVHDADEFGDEQGDYFTLAGPPYSQLPDDGPTPTENPSHYAKGKSAKQEAATQSAALVTPQEKAPSSSSGSSTTESNTGMMKSLKAALHRTPAPQPPPTAVKIPPYLALRLRMSSSSHSTAPAPPPTVQTASVPTSASVPRPPKASHAEFSNPGTQNQQPESRVSEGSSSSSNYDDVSPLPSPATTPDTSRPQSAKGVPLTSDEVSRDLAGEKTPIQDDQRTLRQSSGNSSGADSATITPRAAGRTSEGMSEEDRWSRTAMPMDLDFDNPEDDAWKASPEEEDEFDAEHSPRSDEHAFQPLKPQPANNRARFNSGVSLSAVGQRSSHELNDDPVVPRRSKARDQPKEEPKTSPAKPQPRPQEVAEKEPDREQKEHEHSHDHDHDHDHGQKHGPKQQRRLRKHKPEVEPKPPRESLDDGASIRSVSTIGKSSNSSSNASLLSARFMSPIGGFVPSYGFGSHPFFVDIAELNKPGSEVKVTLPLKVTRTEILLQGSAPPRGRVLPPVTEADPQPAPAPKQARILPPPEGPKPAIKSTSSPPPPPPPPTTAAESKAGPLPKPATTNPVSILKPSPPPQQPSSDAAQSPAPSSKPQVLSAIPKHLQTRTSTEKAVTGPESRMAPIAKMFVECCGCHFYHDMPSKLYECMAKPDAVVEDRNLGISGAITTMVKCPWCQHNMTTKCCAGYAAVVYVKEKLH